MLMIESCHQRQEYCSGRRVACKSRLFAARPRNAFHDPRFRRPRDDPRARKAIATPIMRKLHMIAPALCAIVRAQGREQSAFLRNDVALAVNLIDKSAVRCFVYLRAGAVLRCTLTFFNFPERVERLMSAL